jgi:NADH-quinone oxidoreductase subunit I
MIGKGILKGMVETARNMVGSFHDPERMVTVEYPEQKIPAKESARNFPMLIFDGEDWESGLRCVACQICEKECPPQCIYIEKDTEKKPDFLGKAQFKPKVFDIDISVCMGCQICVEVCPFESIRMDREFEYAGENRFSRLILHKEDLAKSDSYYHDIHPTEASETDAVREQKRQDHLAKERAKAEKAAQAKKAAAEKAAADQADKEEQQMLAK